VCVTWPGGRGSEITTYLESPTPIYWYWSWHPHRKSIPTGRRHLTKKGWRYSQKCVLQSCARNHKKIKKHSNVIFHPFAGGPCGADCCKFSHVRWHPRRNHAYQILSRSPRGLQSYGGPKSGFSYSFSNRSYNSVTHYRATLWISVMEQLALWCRFSLTCTFYTYRHTHWFIWSVISNKFYFFTGQIIILFVNVRHINCKYRVTMTAGQQGSELH